MFCQRLFQWMLPVVVLAGLAAAASAPADPEDRQSVAKQRLQVAQEANDAIKAMRRARENVSSEEVYRWSGRLMEAQMAMSEKKADQIAAINAYLSKVKEMAKLAKQGYEQGELGYLQLLDAKWHVLEAESLLSQAKAEEGT
jgi:outer membrane protein TolC